MAKHNSRFDTPSNARYKNEKHLEKNKIRRIMANQNVDKETASKMWLASGRKRSA